MISTSTFQCVCGNGPGGVQTGLLCQSTYSCQCLNNGVCQSSTDSTGRTIYQCICTPGFGGNLCQYQISSFQSCQTSGCFNGGTCTICKLGFLLFLKIKLYFSFYSTSVNLYLSSALYWYY